MATRALINIFDNDQCVLSIYKQYDGYKGKHGVGETLTKYIKDTLVYTNGMPLSIGNLNDHTGKDLNVHNGVNCLAAGILAHLKDGPGDVYIHNTSDNNFGANFVYSLRPSKDLDNGVTTIDLECTETLRFDGDNLEVLATSLEDIDKIEAPTFNDLTFTRDGTSKRARVRAGKYVFSIATIASGHELDYNFRHYGNESEGTYEVAAWLLGGTGNFIKLGEYDDVLGWQNENSINELLAKAYNSEEVDRRASGLSERVNGSILPSQHFSAE